MLGHTLHHESDPSPVATRTPGPASVPERVVYGVVLASYGLLIVLVAIVSGISAVYLGTVLPDVLPITLLLWMAAIGGIAASPTLAARILRFVLAPPDG